MLDNEDSLPRLLGGRYRLEAKLGSGGMGVVYRATDLTMHRAVAVKLIRSADGVALDEEVAGRFLREAKNTARIQHENLIEVFDLGRSDEGDMYFVMELLEGESLSAKLRRDGKMAPAIAVHIVRQMCAALHVAHTAGIIHRDLKPANIMLLQRGADRSFVKVLDFGVAKSYAPDQETALTHTGMLVGTVEYMAPEQIMGRPVDGRTDLYSVGIVLYRMLTGKAPFRDGGVPALIHAHLNVYPKPIGELAPEVPGELDRVVLRCLAKQPERRYESMEELSRALGEAMPAPILDLEYHGDDDEYASGDRTEVARPAHLDFDSTRSEVSRVAPSAAPDTTRDTPPPAAPPPPTDVRQQLRNLPRLQTDSDDYSSGEFEDATRKIDRSDRFDPSAVVPPRSRDALAYTGDRTAIMNREDLSTEKRSVPDAALRADAGQRECAMCRTKNPPHARACSACGISLAVEDQDAVRARVTAPRTAHLSAPQMPPPVGTPVSGVGALGQGMPYPPQPMMAPQREQVNGPRPTYPTNPVMWPPPPPQAPARSVWRRLFWWLR